jgi:DNA integrity scanning protein DisA with diadenylate cyclase activity
MDRSVLIEKKYGGILVSVTEASKLKENIIIQTNYLMPDYKEDGTLVNEDINKVLVGQNTFVIAIGRDISKYLRVLGENTKIEFSHLHEASNQELNDLSKIMVEYSKKIKDKKNQYKSSIESLKNISSGDIYNFNQIVNDLRKNGFIFNNAILENLKNKCYSEHS